MPHDGVVATIRVRGRVGIAGCCCWGGIGFCRLSLQWVVVKVMWLFKKCVVMESIAVYIASLKTLVSDFDNEDPLSSKYSKLQQPTNEQDLDQGPWQSKARRPFAN